MRRVVSLVVALGLAGGALAACEPAGETAPSVVAHWRMDERPGARVMADSSANGIAGVVGTSVQPGTVVDGATAYRWSPTPPNTPPAQPERLVQVADDRLNPGSRDYAVTVRFRTTRSYGNMIQKGQSETPGGYFKWEIPSGRLMCLFRARDSQGTLLGQKAVTAPTPLNDGAWHTVRCQKTADRVTMTIDGTTVVRSSRGTIGRVANTMPLTIAGKRDCDQVRIGCDYFAGDIDWVRIEASGT